MKIELINKKHGKKFQEHLLEQYKLITKSAESITDKRQNVNRYYLAINSFLFTAAAYLTSIKLNLIPFVIALIGFLISSVWFQNIESFKKLNSAKFKVIHEIENYLPAKIYQKEDEYLKKNYYKLTSVEKYIPYIFAVLYAFIMLVILIQTFV